MICLASFRGNNEDVNAPGPSQRQRQNPSQSNLQRDASSQPQGNLRHLLPGSRDIAKIIANGAFMNNNRGLNQRIQMQMKTMLGLPSLKCEPNPIQIPNRVFFVNLDCEGGSFIANINAFTGDDGNLHTIVLIQDSRSSDRTFSVHVFRPTPSEFKEIMSAQSFGNQIIRGQLTSTGWKENISIFQKYPQTDMMFSIFYIHFFNAYIDQMGMRILQNRVRKLRQVKGK